MNATLVCLYSAQNLKEPFYNGQHILGKTSVDCLEIHNGNTHLPKLCAGEAPYVKVKINELGPNSRAIACVFQSCMLNGKYSLMKLKADEIMCTRCSAELDMF